MGLVVDFVGVLRELKKALQFDSSDVSGVIEDLDLLLQDFLGRIEKAKGDFLDAEDEGSADEKLEKLVYGRFLDPEPRKAFFEAYKEIEALWEILSPSPELRDHITTFTPACSSATRSCSRRRRSRFWRRSSWSERPPPAVTSSSRFRSFIGSGSRFRCVRAGSETSHQSRNRLPG